MRLPDRSGEAQETVTGRSVQPHFPSPRLDGTAALLALEALFLADAVQPALGSLLRKLLCFGKEFGQPLSRIGTVRFLGPKPPGGDDVQPVIVTITRHIAAQTTPAHFVRNMITSPT